MRVDPEDLPVGEIDNLVKQYNLTLKSITDHHAPLKTKVLRARPSAPWYSAEIDAAKRRCRKAEKAWRKNKSEASFKLFKTLRNYVTHLINKARTEYYTDLISTVTIRVSFFGRQKHCLIRKANSAFQTFLMMLCCQMLSVIFS